jgi:hypothetical protein
MEDSSRLDTLGVKFSQKLFLEISFLSYAQLCRRDSDLFSEPAFISAGFLQWCQFNSQTEIKAIWVVFLFQKKCFTDIH